MNKFKVGDKLTCELFKDVVNIRGYVVVADLGEKFYVLEEELEDNSGTHLVFHAEEIHYAEKRFEKVTT